MNSPEGDNKFVPRQALAPTPQLYDELVGDSMEMLAKASLSQIPSISTGSVVHDNGCGTGAGSAAIVNSTKADLLIKGTDINKKALKVYETRAAHHSWPAEALPMDSQKLSFADDTFSHSIANALVFVLPNDGIDVMKETYRTLKPGGTAIVNSWAYLPNMVPLNRAATVTRPPGMPTLRQGIEKWVAAEFLQGVLEKGGFEKDKITMKRGEVYCTTPELTHFATMLWSFIGGTSEIGWLKSDEENWDKAVDVVKEELQKTEGFEALDGGRAKLKFLANIAIATK